MSMIPDLPTGPYPLRKLKNLWSQERITIEQIFGQIIPHLELLYEEIKQLRRDLLRLENELRALSGRKK